MARNMSLRDLARFLNASANKIAEGDHWPALSRFRDLLYSGVKESFSGSKDPFGTPWRPLVYRVGKPLILTGHLQASTLAAVKSANIDHNRLEISNLAFYAGFHNEGTSTTPRREFLGFGPHLMNSFDKILTESIYSVFKV